MEITVERPGREDHRFRVNFRIDGHAYSGWLSRDLKGAGDARTLILATIPESEVPDDYKPAFREFMRRVHALDKRATAAVKRAAVRIKRPDAPEWKNPSYCIALHKMGPVSAFMLRDVPVYVEATGTYATIALYPSERADASREDHQHPVALALWESLISVDTYKVLISYFEEIFQHLKDISDKLGIVDCMARLRAIREIAGQSIADKLANLTPSPQAWKLYVDYQRQVTEDRWPSSAAPPLNAHDLEVCRWFAQHHKLICEFIFLACVIGQCVSDMLDLVGLNLNTKNISVTVRNIRYSDPQTSIATFHATYELEYSKYEPSPMVFTVERLLDLFGRPDTEVAGEDVPDEMTANLRDFLTFVKSVRNELDRIYDSSLPSQRGPVFFLSRRFSSMFGSMSKQTFAKVVDAVWGDGPSVTTFEGLGGDDLPHAIMAQIWLADSFWSIFPESDAPAGDDLTYIYQEAEQALLLGKRPTVIARNGEDWAEILRRLATVDAAPFSDGAKRFRERLRGALLSHLRGTVAILGETEPVLAEKIAKRLLKLRSTIATSRRQALLEGYLRMFQDNDVAVFYLIDRFFRHNESFDVITFKRWDFDARAPLATIGKDAFAHAHDRAKDLALKHRNTALSVVQRLQGSQKYRFNLDRIARGFTGNVDIPDSVITADVRAALDRALAPVFAQWRNDTGPLTKR